MDDALIQAFPLMILISGCTPLLIKTYDPLLQLWLHQENNSDEGQKEHIFSYIETIFTSFLFFATY